MGLTSHMQVTGKLNLLNLNGCMKFCLHDRNNPNSRIATGNIIYKLRRTACTVFFRSTQVITYASSGCAGYDIEHVSCASFSDFRMLRSSVQRTVGSKDAL